MANQSTSKLQIYTKGFPLLFENQIQGPNAWISRTTKRPNTHLNADVIYSQLKKCYIFSVELNENQLTEDIYIPKEVANPTPKISDKAKVTQVFQTSQLTRWNTDTEQSARRLNGQASRSQLLTCLCTDFLNLLSPVRCRFTNSCQQGTAYLVAASQMHLNNKHQLNIYLFCWLCIWRFCFSAFSANPLSADASRHHHLAIITWYSMYRFLELIRIICQYFPLVFTSSHSVFYDLQDKQNILSFMWNRSPSVACCGCQCSLYNPRHKQDHI